MRPQHIERPLDGARPEGYHLDAGEHRTPRVVAAAVEHPGEAREILHGREEAQHLEATRERAIHRQEPYVAQDGDANREMTRTQAQSVVQHGDLTTK